VDKLTDLEVLRIIQEQVRLNDRQKRAASGEPDMPAPDVARSGALWKFLTETCRMSPEKAEEAMR
jgi:hypothetical protein